MTSEQAVILHDTMGLFAKQAGEALCAILKSNIQIQSPQRREMLVKEVEYSLLEPVMFVKCCLTEGSAGTIAMIFRQRDIQVFLNALMGNEDLPEPDFVFDEVAVSAATEIMNQMIKTAGNAVSDYLVEGQGMKISSCQLLLSDESLKLDKVMGESGDAKTMVVSYRLLINDMIESDFLQCFSEEAIRSIDEALERKEENELQKLLEEKKDFSDSAGAGTPVVPVGMQAARRPGLSAGAAGSQTAALSYSGAAEPAYAESGYAGPEVKGNLGLIMNVPLNVCVEIGKTRRKLKDVLNFNNGTVIELDKAADAPVDIIVNGQLIARGEVVVIDDNFGVKINEIINTKNIIRNGGLL